MKYINTNEMENMLKNEARSLYILEGSNMRTKKELFVEIATKLQFPNYFGKNYNALDECIQDLEWIDSDSIKILIRNFDVILQDEEYPDEKDVFCDCLRCADVFWKTDQTKNVDFYIQFSGKACIFVNGRVRILDGLTTNALSVVKHTKRQTFTQQLHDFYDYAEANGLEMDLYIRLDTSLSKPLKEAIDFGKINSIIIPE